MDIQLQDSLAESLRWRCKESASDTAIKFLDREQTYAEFDSNSNLVAQGLLDLGIEPNSRVAYLAKNTDYFFEIFFGSLKTKSVVVGVNWRLAAEEVAYVLEDSKSEVLFVSSDFFNIIDQIEEKLSLKKTDEWVKEMEKLKIPCGPIFNIKQAVENPQVQERNMIISSFHKKIGEFKSAGNPIKLSTYKDEKTRGDIPDLDEHREKIIKEFC